MLKYLFVSIIIAITISKLTSVPPLKHSHTNKERESDGAYRVDDSKHYVDGKHNTEFDHVAFLGSVREAEEFDSLTPEQSKKRLRLLLNKVDINGNGIIERNELKAWIIRSFRSLSDEDGSERFTDADINEDGKVTWKEHVYESFGSSEDEKEVDFENDVDSEHTRMLYFEQLLFNASDMDKNGFLTKEEFLIFNSPEEHEETRPIVLNQTLSEKDVNKNGVIDFDEFVDERNSDVETSQLESEKSKFDSYDLDKNGVLNDKEILEWIVPNNEEIADEEVSHLFLESDDNDDGVLSFDEIIDHYDVFVGSEATNYGEQLEHDEL